MEEQTDTGTTHQRPTDCQNHCGGTVVYVATRMSGGQLQWVKSTSGLNQCKGTGCHDCPPTEQPLREFQEVGRPCQSLPCPVQSVIPTGDPDDFFRVTIPFSQLTNAAIEDQELKFPVTPQGWRLWKYQAVGGSTSGNWTDGLDEYRRWVRTAMVWMMGVLFAGAVLKELRV